MFATSDWEPDVPKGAINFGKKAINKKDSKQSNLTSSTENQKPSTTSNKRLATKNIKNKFYKPDKSSNTTLSKSLKRNGLGKTISNKFNNSILERNTFVNKKPRTELTNRQSEKNMSTFNSHLNSKPMNTPVKKTDGVLNSPKKLRKFNENCNAKGENKPVKNKKKKKNKKNENANSKIEPNTDQTNKDNVCSGELKLSGDNPRKHKLNNNSKQTTKPKKLKTVLETSIESLDLSNFDSDMPDEVIIEKKKKLLNEALKQDDREDLLFSENKPINNKKERLKKLLNNKEGLERNKIKTSGLSLRARMLEKLKAAQFRYLNEKLYTSSGSEAQQLFQSDPASFQTYHEGYQLQLSKWPINPLDVIIKTIQKLPKTALIADMGCGEAKLAQRVQQIVRSFDLVSAAAGVEACDMARTTLLTSSMDAVVYCLALMGTDLTQYLAEANRVLKTGGLLLIAEVESRFEDADGFSKEVQRLGFKLLKLDKSHQVFFFMQFKKVQEAPKKSKLPALVLKPCFYKRR